MLMRRRECLALIGMLTIAGCGSGGSSGGPPAGAGAPTPPPTPAPTPTPQTFTPESFGATGDGITNDTHAFAQLSAAVNAAGGGTVILRGTTYLVGAHVPDPASAYAFGPGTIMKFDGCAQDLKIMGNGARLRCADGLRFGTFNPLTGLPTQHSLPYYETGELASPYLAMISVENCRGVVYIENVELDGNLANLLIGGPYGDTGWQIPAYGLRLVNNLGSEHITNVHTHHQPVDGVLIDGAA